MKLSALFLALAIGSLLPHVARRRRPRTPFAIRWCRCSSRNAAPNFAQPWTKSPPREGSGTGFVIDGKRIMTNAHVVRYGSQIYVQAYQSPDKVPAKVVAVAPGIDLAVLSVEEPGFFDNRPPIPMGEGLPKVKGTVNVYGFPLGGDQMSVTEGIISRVEAAAYVYRTPGLACKSTRRLTPATAADRPYPKASSWAWRSAACPRPRTSATLSPWKRLPRSWPTSPTARYDGKPQLFDEFQTVENDALRARLGLPKGAGGAMVTRPAQSDDGYPLKEWDVIVKIGEHAIDSAAKVQVAADLQLPFTYYVPKLAHDGRVQLTVLRGGQEMVLDVPVPAELPSKVPYLKDGYPSYFIYGPLVFTPLCKEMVAAYGQLVLRDRLLVMVEHLNDPPDFAGEQVVVVVSPMFSHRITKSYGQPMPSMLSSVNGERVRNLATCAATARRVGRVHRVQVRRPRHGDDGLSPRGNRSGDRRNSDRQWHPQAILGRRCRGLEGEEVSRSTYFCAMPYRFPSDALPRLAFGQAAGDGLAAGRGFDLAGRGLAEHGFLLFRQRLLAVEVRLFLFLLAILLRRLLGGIGFGCVGFAGFLMSGRGDGGRRGRDRGGRLLRGPLGQPPLGVGRDLEKKLVNGR